MEEQLQFPFAPVIKKKVNCLECDGEGQVDGMDCQYCDGTGKMEIEVKKEKK